MGSMRLLEYRESDYPNYLDTIPFDYDGLMAVILGSSGYSAPPSIKAIKSQWGELETSLVENWACQYKDDLIPHPPCMVSMAAVMHGYIDKYGKLPTQQEFEAEYINVAAVSIRGLLEFGSRFSGVDVRRLAECVRYRINRSYPSLVRDLEFALLLRKFGHDVSYNENLDIYGHVDIMYRSPASGRYYGIHLYTDSERSNRFRDAKDSRGDLRYTNVTAVEYAINLGRPAVNGYILYDESDVARLDSMIKYNDINI